MILSPFSPPAHICRSHGSVRGCGRARLACELVSVSLAREVLSQSSMSVQFRVRGQELINRRLSQVSVLKNKHLPENRSINHAAEQTNTPWYDISALDIMWVFEVCMFFPVLLNKANQWRVYSESPFIQPQMQL